MKPAMPTVDATLFAPTAYHGPPAEHWPGRVWHYTNSHRAKRIIADGDAGHHPQGYVDRDPPPGAKSILWFSRNHVFEPVSCHAFSGFTWEWNGQQVPKTFTFEGSQAFGTKLVRLAVPAELAPYGHHAAFRLAGYTTKHSRWLERVGAQLGGRCDDWRGTLDSVPKEEWLAVEVWDNVHCHWSLVWAR